MGVNLVPIVRDFSIHLENFRTAHTTSPTGASLRARIGSCDLTFSLITRVMWIWWSAVQPIIQVGLCSPLVTVTTISSTSINFSFSTRLGTQPQRVPNRHSVWRTVRKRTRPQGRQSSLTVIPTKASQQAGPTCITRRFPANMLPLTASLTVTIRSFPRRTQKSSFPKTPSTTTQSAPGSVSKRTPPQK